METKRGRRRKGWRQKGVETERGGVRKGRDRMGWSRKWPRQKELDTESGGKIMGGDK